MANPIEMFPRKYSFSVSSFGRLQSASFMLPHFLSWNNLAIRRINPFDVVVIEGFNMGCNKVQL